MFTPPIPLSVDNYDELIDYFGAEFKHLPVDDYSKVLDLMSRAYKIGREEATKRAVKEMRDCTNSVASYYSIL